MVVVALFVITAKCRMILFSTFIPHLLYIFLHLIKYKMPFINDFINATN